MTHNFDNWTYADFVQFAKAMTENDLESALVLLSEVTELTNDQILDMDVESADRLTYEAMQELNAIIEKINISKCKVDLKKWSMRRMNEFRKAQQEQKAALVEEMLHEVATLEGTSPDKPLTFVQGATMVRAVLERHGKLLSGKA